VSQGADYMDVNCDIIGKINIIFNDAEGKTVMTIDRRNRKIVVPSDVQVDDAAKKIIRILECYMNDGKL